MSQSERKPTLQPSHVRAYRFIEKSIERNKFAPEYTEIAKAIKLTQRQTYRIIGDLVELGYVSRRLRQKRSLQIIKSMD